MKRGDSGLSLVVPVNKPKGATSHDVVNRCRKIFNERRCGHTGTLDPLATGVLPICIGPATRLDRFMVANDKRYRVRIAFGAQTTTDDSDGDIVATSTVPAFIRDPSFALDRVSGLVGEHMQVPPAYSAVKVNGTKAYEAARKGGALDLEPRRIEIFDAHLIVVEDDGADVSWVIDLRVSKGTYIRSIARDLGRVLTCPAHVASLERIQSGAIGIKDCTDLETLEILKQDAAIDPVRVLGYRYAFADEVERFVASGNALKPSAIGLFEALDSGSERDGCGCVSRTVISKRPPEEGELISIIVANRLKAIYRFEADSDIWKPKCVFSTSVYRG